MKSQPTTAADGSMALRVFSAGFGLLLGLALLKFPNPPVLEHLVPKPTGAWEWALAAWPVHYGQVLLLLVGGMGVFLARRPGQVPLWLSVLPLGWLAWIGLSAIRSIAGKLSGLTLVHFAACVACFYLGLMVLGRGRRLGGVVVGLMGAFALVIAVGWHQHFGGLEESRRYFFTYLYPTQTTVPPELLKKMQSDRIFSTLFYPNSLAGAVLLLTPLCLGAIADARERLTAGARWLAAGIVSAGAAGCLVWSGSKAGWLVALLMAGVALLKLPISRRVKVIVLAVLLAAGLGGFLARYLGFFQRGATSVVARFDYWRAASQNALAHPVFGTGPGTFGTVYPKLKSPDAEMARLVHNDYLQQASDSGLIGGLLFVGLVGAILFMSCKVWDKPDWIRKGVWLGLVGFALQSTVEFGFYVPATAWCWFALAGWLTTTAGLGFDKQEHP